MLVLASVCPSIPSSNQRASLLGFTPFLGVYFHTKVTATFENIAVIMWQLDSPDTLSVTYVLHDMTQQPSDIITQPISLIASGMQLPPSALNTCLGSFAQIHCPLFRLSWVLFFKRHYKSLQLLPQGPFQPVLSLSMTSSSLISPESSFY